MGPIGVCMVIFAIVWISCWIYRWRNPKCNGKIPPGSMGFPLFGETQSFFSSYTASDVRPFIRTSMERYGPIFKTSLVGQPVIVSTNQDFNHFIFQQEDRLFQSWWPESFRETFGTQSMGSLHGFMHKYLKGLDLKLFGVEILKESLLREVDQFARRTLSSWSTQPSIEVKEATSDMIFDLTAKRLMSYNSSASTKKWRENFVAFLDGLISFPINIPGTFFYKCMQGRKKAMRVLKNVLEERRASPEKRCGDFYDALIDELKKERSMLTERLSMKWLGWLILPLEFSEEQRRISRSKNVDTSQGSKNFGAFGGGTRFCVGADFSRVQMPIFLHHLVTKYRWIAVKGGESAKSGHIISQWFSHSALP